MSEIPGGSLSALVAGVDRLLHVGHRFGMSDNDPQNVSAIIRAMCDSKKKCPDKRFFVINTHEGEKVKLEVFPGTFPVAGRPGEVSGEPYDWWPCCCRAKTVTAGTPEEFSTSQCFPLESDARLVGIIH